MCGKRVLSIFTAIVLAGFMPADAISSSKSRTVRAHVRFLATSTSIRSSWAGNQDVYLSQIEFNGSAKTLARLIDEYPSYRVALPYEVLTSASATSFRLRRDRGCDVAYGLMPLRTAPGDPMAILPEPLSFQPALSELMDPAEVIPCYRVVRR